MNLNKAKRIVIKIGSSLLVSGENNKIRQKWLNSLASDIAELHQSGKKIVIVSSGAIAVGRGKLSTNKKNLKLEEKQAAAACGQFDLISAYQKSLSRHNLTAAQVLLTIGDSEDRRRYLNSRNTLETLLQNNIIPVINENDTVATSEIRFGDNDRLAARVSQMVQADLLVLFSDIDGLYNANPRENKDVHHIAEVKEITKDIEEMAGGIGTESGSGGMVTKIAAAKIATDSGCHTVIAKGMESHPLSKLMSGGKHTIFTSSLNPASARKRWIAHRLETNGKVIIDDGAISALKQGKSLLPAGVKNISGKFSRGDTILVVDKNGTEIGRGLTAYDSDDAKKIIGKNSKDIADILGFSGRNELIHRDDMVVL